MSPTFCLALRRTGRPFLPARPRASACRLCGPPGASDSAKPHREISIGRSERERERERARERARVRVRERGERGQDIWFPLTMNKAHPPARAKHISDPHLRSAHRSPPPLLRPSPPALTCSSASDSATLSALTLEAQEGDSPTVTSPEVLH